MINVLIRNYVEMPRISEPKIESGRTTFQKKDTFSNKLIMGDEMEDIGSEEMEREILSLAIPLFVPYPFIEDMFVIEHSHLGNLSDVGEFFQEISRQAFFLESREEIHHTTEFFQESLLMKDLQNRLSLQEGFTDVLQQFSEEGFTDVLEQFSEEGFTDALQQLAEELGQIPKENQRIERAELQNIDGQDSKKEEASEDTFFRVKKDSNKEQEVVVPNEVSIEQATPNEISAVGMTYEKTTLSNLANKLQQRIDYLQNFIVRTDKAFIQLNPENLGKLDVVMQKIGDTLMIEVDIYEHLAKKSVEAIFEDLQMKFQEKHVEVQFYFSERESKEQKEQQKQQKQERHQEISDKKISKRFDEILGGVEDV